MSVAENIGNSIAGRKSAVFVNAAGRSMVLLVALACVSKQIPATAQVNRGPANPVEAAMLEFALDEERLKSLLGKTANLLYVDGRREEEVTLQDYVQVREQDRFRTLTITRKDETTKRRIPASRLFQVEIEDTAYRVNYLPSTKSAVLEDNARRLETVEARLRQQGLGVWEPYSGEELADFVAEEKEFLGKVGMYFNSLPMKLYETNYFLFFTDMPAAQVAPYITKLDKMNETLSTAFGYAPGSNIWRGKLPIVCFVDKVPFLEFERVFMQNPNADGAQGLCHQSTSGRVVVGCYRGDDPNYFGALLVHETSHGFVHRYLSPVHFVSWLNEGLAEWVALAVVPQDIGIPSKVREATGILRQSGSLGGDFFQDGQITAWQYGAAYGMVDMMIKENPAQFRLFLNGIKEGIPWVDSLKRAYDVTPTQLALLYGRLIRVPNLQP